ncbi:MAG: LbtU family siderophore porin [Gammaproteobacteria bacterium]|nr:LbtU family siderophore porin [Gammaproteobacteria bacterium]
MNKMKSVLSTALLAGLMGSGAVMAEAMVSGVIETELTSGEDYAGASAMDIAVATVELGVDAEVSSDVSAHVLFLYEDDGATALEVDEATISISFDDANTLTVGQTYVPFGKFDTNVVSDPLTLELGETRDSVIMIENMTNNVTTSFYVFKGDSMDAAAAASADDTELGYGLNVTFSEEELYELGFGYTTNIADSDLIQGLGGSADVADYVAGMAINASYTSGPTTLLVEHVTAMDDFVNGDLGGGITATAQPSTTHVELAYDMGEGRSVALAYGMTAEAAEFGLAESAMAIAFSTELREGASLALEYATMDDYGVGSTAADTGTGESASQITVQLAAEF